MPNISTFFYRLYHYGLKLLISFLPPPSPSLLKGRNALKNLIGNIQANKIDKLLLVTDREIKSFGLHQELCSLLTNNKITISLYTDVEPNNPINNIEQALNHYQQTQCQGIICLGGGSVMDCGKLIAARIARPDKSVRQLEGLFKVRRKLPPVYAIPTIAGTG